MNYYLAIWCLLAVTTFIKADGGLGLGGLVYAPGHASANYYAYPRYAFEYAVNDPHTGDNKAQWEKRDGDVVKGAYSLVEPDGSLRIVEYWADAKSGFNAVVKRIGPNLHPASIPAAPIYKAPIPLLSSGAIATPISIGPVAKYSGLASAPLITGPLGLGGAAISTASLIKSSPIDVAAPVASVLSAPIVNNAPLLGPMGAAPWLSTQAKSSSYLGSLPWGSLPGPIISAPAPLLKAPLGISAVSLGDGLLKGSLGGYDNYNLGLANGGYNIGLGLAKGGYDNYRLGLAKGGYNNIGQGLAKGGYNNIGQGIAKGGYDNYNLGLANGGYNNIGLGLAKGGYNNIGLGLAKVGYNNYDQGLANGGYANLGLGLAKSGYDNNLGLGLLAKGGYANYDIGLAKGGPALPVLGGAWSSSLDQGWKH